MGLLNSIWDSMADRIIPEETYGLTSLTSVDMRMAIEDARRDWQAAQSYFSQVSEPDLVDHAIHWLAASEKRYMYLLKKAKEEGLTM